MASDPDLGMVESAVVMLLVALGEDPDRPGLERTPERAAAAWHELLTPDDRPLTTFESDVDEAVVVTGIRVWSVCEHHLLPYWCDVALGYIPAGRILGLSKFARIARRAAAGLTVQEELTSTMADLLTEATGSTDVAVLCEGEHLCMVVRGIREREARTYTQVLRGAFHDKPEARAEWSALVSG